MFKNIPEQDRWIISAIIIVVCCVAFSLTLVFGYIQPKLIANQKAQVELRQKRELYCKQFQMYPMYVNNQWVCTNNPTIPNL